jgi:hypothetical protein
MSRIALLVVPLALLGCGGHTPEAHRGHAATCAIEPQPLRAKSVVRSRSWTRQIVDFPPRGAEPALHSESIDERDDTTTMVEVQGATIRRALVEVTRHRVSNADGKMVSGPMDGLQVEVMSDGGELGVHPIGTKLDAETKTSLVDAYRHVGKANPFLSLGTTTLAVSARSPELEGALALWMRRDKVDASGQADKVEAVLTHCEPELATFNVQLRLKGRQHGWDLDGHVEGQLVVARHDGRPTHVLFRTTMTGSAPDATGKATIKAEQRVDNEYE